MNKRALISVFNKNGILDLASYLAGAGWEILSTGGTAKYLKEQGLAVLDVSALTGFPECLDGRVKTLHPAIHAGILARRGEKSHMDTLAELKLSPIDMVCVNLYPFFEKARAGLSLEETVEFIDIGGPAMLRSAAKNYQDLIVLTDPEDYEAAIDGLKSGAVSGAFRKRLAGKVFELCSAYDAAIARFLLELDRPADPDAGQYPAYWPLSLKKAPAGSLRYGENSHQSAALYLNTVSPGALDGMEQLNGKELGYNNIRDLDLAWKAACAFGFPPENKKPAGEEELVRLGLETGGESACCIAVKHNTPCGAALAPTLIEACEKTCACDPVSIFGGIVASTVTLDAATAEKLSGLFLEIVAAPDFDPEALEILKKKKNLRIIKARRAPGDLRECISVDGGLLVQEADRRLLEKWEVVTKTMPRAADIPDLIFGLRVVSYVKSNAVAVIKDRAAAGIGGGQTNRIWAAEQALARAKGVIRAAAGNPALKGAIADGKDARVLASDAFFPFADVVEAAAAAGIKAIIQPGGSIRDRESIEACDRLGLAMVFTGTRHFKH
jgi:phosphoribosylaminoimidazolecarboxamide formyltransferase/IMP cyclohydrolase